MFQTNYQLAKCNFLCFQKNTIHMLFYFYYRKTILGMFDCCQNCLHNSMFIPKVIVAFLPSRYAPFNFADERSPPLRRGISPPPLDPSKAHVGAPASAYSAVFNHFSAFFILILLKLRCKFIQRRRSNERSIYRRRILFCFYVFWTSFSCYLRFLVYFYTAILYLRVF